MGPIRSPETKVLNHVTLRNNPEDGRIRLNRGGSLRSCISETGSVNPMLTCPWKQLVSVIRIIEFLDFFRRPIKTKTKRLKITSFESGLCFCLQVNNKIEVVEG